MWQIARLLRNMLIMALLLPLLSHAAPMTDDTVNTRTRVSRDDHVQLVGVQKSVKSTQQYIEPTSIQIDFPHITHQIVKDTNIKFIRINKSLESHVQIAANDTDSQLVLHSRLGNDAKQKSIYTVGLKVPI